VMSDYDAIIIGAGPAGLTAGLYLARARRRVALIEKESFGGPVINYDRIEDYPGFSQGVVGAQLVNEMVEQAANAGVELESNEVIEIENFSSCRSVSCIDGKTYTARVVILTGGAHPKDLRVPGETKFKGQGVFHCAYCDGGQVAGKVAAVCGGGDSALAGAIYLSTLAQEVYVIESSRRLSAITILQERAKENPKIKMLTDTRVTSIVGDDHVQGIEVIKSGGEKEVISADGVLVHIGVQANTEYLQSLLELDEDGRIPVNQRMETAVPYILAAGDIRAGAPNKIVAAAGDGAVAGITAEELLQQI
jgi:thioredoxin reductase (NADPH)